MTYLQFALLSALVVALSAGGQAQAGCRDGDSELRLNQSGFYTGGAKRAVIAAPTTRPVAWELVDHKGAVRARGKTTVYGDDPVAGEHVHQLDFSAFDQAGRKFELRSGCAVSHAFDIAERPYSRLKYDALAYFYHNRAGVPIEERYAGSAKLARPAAHTEEIVTCRTGKDSNGNEWPGCAYELDVTGGWYDAGDHGKYVVNGGISVWTLLNLHERLQARGRGDAFADGQAAIPEAGNGVSDLLDEARFELEFLLRMQAPPGAAASVPLGITGNRANLEFTAIDASGMAHHKVADENWTPLPMPPHLDPQQRMLYPVSTGATLNLAAVAAQCARIWRDLDSAFAARCETAAERAWDGAQRNPEAYFIADFGGSGMYGDSTLSDEFFWAAAELFVTTGKPAYAEALRGNPHFLTAPAGEAGWPQVAPLGAITLALLPNGLEAHEIAAFRQRLIARADGFAAQRDDSGYHIPFATDRYVWGSNAEILNRVILLAYAFDLTQKDIYRDAAIDAMDYLLGRNPLDQSFVSGYGERPMRHPHHRFWAPSFDPGLPGPPPGALSGGPNNSPPADDVAKGLYGSCAPQTCWADDARAYSLNEVAINWNAPLVWVSAFLDDTAD
jgi:endoglucanase